MSDRAALAIVVKRFDLEIYALAMRMAHKILDDELGRRRRSTSSRPKVASMTTAATVPSPRDVVADNAPPTRSTRSRLGWTRDAVIAELSSFLRTKFVVDGAFIHRHGPRGLVAAAKKHFGRLDAALNVASLARDKRLARVPATDA